MSATHAAERWEGRTVAEWQVDFRVPELHIFHRTTSTNDHIRERALAGAAAGATAIADVQSAGRGRSGRAWSAAPDKSVLISMLLRAEHVAADPSTMPLRVGLATALAIEAVAGVRVRIKWPNDLLLSDTAKVAGILCEGATSPDGAWLVAGIGINVLQDATDFPVELRATATSLRIAGARVERPALIAALIDALRPFAIRPPPLDPHALEQIAARDALKGHEITVDGQAAGIARGIGPDAALIVETPRGLRTFRNGTVRRSSDSNSAPRHSHATSS